MEHPVVDVPSSLLHNVEACFIALSLPSSSGQLGDGVPSSSFRRDLYLKALAATASLPDLLENHTFSEDETSKYSDVFISRWPDIKAWLKTLANDLVRVAVDALDGDGSIRASICKIVFLVVAKFGSQEVKDTLVRDDELFEFATQMWHASSARSRRVLTKGQCKEWVAETSPHYSALLGRLMSMRSQHATLRGRIWSVTQVDEAASYVQTQLANSLRARSTGPEKAQHVIYECFYFVNALQMHLEDRKECAHAVASYLAPILVKVLVFFIKLAAKERWRDICQLSYLEDICALAKLAFINCFASEAPATPLLRHTVCKGLFEALALVPVVVKNASTSHATLDNFDEVTSLVQSRVICELCHKRWLKLVINKLLPQSQLLVDEEGETPKFPSRGTLWLTALEYAIIMYVFDAFASLEKYCDNCNEGLDSVDKLWVCSGCRLQHYCSKRCQKVAWRERAHRLYCSRLQERRDSLRDDVHFARLAATDVRHSLPGIRALAGVQHPNLDPSNLIFVANYTVQHEQTPKGFECHVLPTCAISIALPEALMGAYENGEADYARCRERGLQCVVVQFYAEKQKEGVEARALSLVIGVRVPFSFCKSYRYGPYSSGSAGDSSSRRGPHRDSYGIARTPRFAYHRPGDNGTVFELDAVEWDDVDEVWARAAASGSFIWDAVKEEARKMVEESVRTERHGRMRRDDGVEVLGYVKGGFGRQRR